MAAHHHHRHRHHHHHHHNYYLENKSFGVVLLPKASLEKSRWDTNDNISCCSSKPSNLRLQTVDRIEIANRHSRGRGKGTTYSVGGRGGGPRIHFSEGESRSRHFGDMVFFSQGAVVFKVYEVEDAAGIKRLIKAANPHIKWLLLLKWQCRFFLIIHSQLIQPPILVIPYLVGSWLRWLVLTYLFESLSSLPPYSVTPTIFFWRQTSYWTFLKSIKQRWTKKEEELGKRLIFHYVPIQQGLSRSV